LLLQFLIALFAGMVLATMLGPVRRSLPDWFEAVVWLALIVVCWLAVTGVDIGHTRELTESALWGAYQVVGTSVGLLGAGAVGWALDHRYVISEWMVLLLGCDILALALMRSRRRALGWQPRVLLGEWFEFPIQRELAPVGVPVTESAVDELNRKGAAAAAVFGPTAATWFVNFLIWTRDVFIPRAAARQAEAVAAGRVRASAGMASLRGTAGQVESAARAWHVSHAPAINALAMKAGDVVDMQAILNAQSIGWFGAVPPMPGDRSAADDAGPSDRLAS
jgi:hypothetical protein